MKHSFRNGVSYHLARLCLWSFVATAWLALTAVGPRIAPREAATTMAAGSSTSLILSGCDWRAYGSLARRRFGSVDTKMGQRAVHGRLKITSQGKSEPDELGP